MESRRFHALDALRGICAAIVLFYHTFLHGPLGLFGHGYLSVDVFFALSGFVLAYAFGDRLEAGMRPADFMRARIRRLGPIVWFAAGFSVVGVLATEILGGPGVPLPAVMLAGLQSLFLLPMTGVSHIDAFPLNGPLWSLFAEFWVNAGFARVAARLRLSTLAAIIVAGWLFLIVRTLGAGTIDFGAAQSDILYAIPRAAPTFACGVLIFRLWRSGSLSKLPSVNPMLVLLVWIAISLAPNLGPVFDLVQTMVVAPIVIALLARSSRTVPRWTLWLGRISYPLYATHVVIIYAGQRLAHGALPVWALVVLPAMALLLADVLARWYEPAFRIAATRLGLVAQNAAA
jgi:peptidoglycan/LPS O-acetylase OafA/YrhL